MDVRDFILERYFAKREFTAKRLMSSSDCESLSMGKLLAMADAETSKMWKNLKLGYTETQGHPLLREEISRLYRTVGPENILALAPEEGIFIAMNCMLKKGDHAIVVSPAYQSLYEVIRASGCKVTKWEHDGGKGWELEIEALEDAITPRTKLIVVNFPHNPTGYLPSARKFREIVSIAEERGLFLFSDEMYRMLETGGRLPAACDIYEKAVSLFGLSKSFSLPGLRTGWLATRDERLFRKFASFKDYTTICGSAPSEVLAVIALRARDRILKRNMSIIRSNTKLANRFFSENKGLFSWTPPKAGPVAFPELKSGTRIDDFCEDLLMKENLMLLPGSVYEHEGDHFRIGLGRKNFPECLKILEKYVMASGQPRSK